MRIKLGEIYLLRMLLLSSGRVHSGAALRGLKLPGDYE